MLTKNPSEILIIAANQLAGAGANLKDKHLSLRAAGNLFRAACLDEARRFGETERCKKFHMNAARFFAASDTARKQSARAIIQSSIIRESAMQLKTEGGANARQ